MVYGSVYNNTSSSFADVQPYEFEEGMTIAEMGAQMIQENTENYNAIMRGIALTELSYVAENNGQELIYESVDFKAIGNAIITALKKLWAKICGIADAVVAKFNTWLKDDKKFYEKYKKKIESGKSNIPDGFKAKGYKFNETNLDADMPEPKTTSDITSLADSIKNGLRGENIGEDYNSSNIDKTLDEARATLTYSVYKEGQNYSKALHEAFYGSAEKVSLTAADVSGIDYEGIITGTKKTIDAVKKARDNNKKQLDQYKKDVESACKSVPKDDEDSRKITTALGNMSSAIKKISNLEAEYFKVKISALKDRNRQAKALVVKLVSFADKADYKQKFGSKNESTYYGNEGSLFESAFADILQ